MMYKPILIVGAGGFGREVFWLINEINSQKLEWDVLGFLDDDKKALDNFENYPTIIGTTNDYGEINNRYTGSVFLINAIGDPSTRKKTVFSLSNAGAKWATLIHPTASIGTNSVINEGSILARNSIVTCDAKIGCHVHINIFSSCDHDTTIGDFCTISPKVDIQGGAQVGEGVFFGGNAVVLPKARVGDWSRVGALSLVLRNVKPKTTVFGVPAKDIMK
jgi:sugar O-acyltransferase (sialic acid O-acetyltransferase NeuD family)